MRKPHTLATLMLFGIFSSCLTASSLYAATPKAQSAKLEALAEPILRKMKLSPSSQHDRSESPKKSNHSWDCINLSTRAKREDRQRRWLKAIEAMAKQSPALVHGWMSGQIKPPKILQQEPLGQLECMVGQMLKDSSTSKKKLRLDLYQPSDKAHWSARKWSKAFDKSPKDKARVMKRVIRSHYRNAHGQAFIWRRKFNFPKTLNNFNRVSPQASELCKLSAHRSWRPKSKRHQQCWKQVLNPTQRQREIMMASSAPGISRHHWGTDFDIFGLNPHRFLKGGHHWDEYQWMQEHALDYGFFQPFTGPEHLGPYTYMEERWHWSYAPLGQAIALYMEKNSDQIQRTLEGLWSGLEKSWFGKKKHPELFSFVRKHWHFYAFRISPVNKR